MIKKIKKLIWMILFDGILWLSIYSVFKENEYQGYAENLILFVCWFFFVMIVIFSAGKEGFKKEGKDAFEEPELISGYGIVSSVLESFAVATIGMHFTATAHLLCGLLTGNLRADFKKHRESLSKKNGHGTEEAK